jgi:hypothetical protein
MKIPTTTVKKGDETKVINTADLETAKAEGWSPVGTQAAEKSPDDAGSGEDTDAPGAGSDDEPTADTDTGGSDSSADDDSDSGADAPG